MVQLNNKDFFFLSLERVPAVLRGSKQKCSHIWNHFFNLVLQAVCLSFMNIVSGLALKYQ